MDLDMIMIEAVDGQLLIRCDRVPCRRRGVAVARMVAVIDLAQRHIEQAHTPTHVREAHHDHQVGS